MIKTYSIAKFTPKYYINVDRLAPLYRNDDNQQIFAKTFETVESAKEWIENYTPCGSEYFVCESDIIDYIGRDGDDTNYDWDDCNCDCGECDICHQYKVDQDLQMIKDNSL